MKIDWSNGRSLSDVIELLEEAQMILHEECVDHADSGLIGRRNETETLGGEHGRGLEIVAKTMNGALGAVITKVKQLKSGSLKVNIDGSVKE